MTKTGIQSKKDAYSVENTARKHSIKFVYFSEDCVVFSHKRIAFPKNVEVKHTIYFDWP